MHKLRIKMTVTGHGPSTKILDALLKLTRAVETESDIYLPLRIQDQAQTGEKYPVITLVIQGDPSTVCTSLAVSATEIESSGGVLKLKGGILEPLVEEVDWDSVPIEELNLTVRAYNSLKRMGIQTLGVLIGKREIEIQAIPNLGEKALGEIREALLLRGLEFRKDD